MILRRFFDDKLAQASYLIGCGRTKQAIVFDPNRDAAQYVAAAKAERLKITFVTETHIHADFASGTRELAAATGAGMLLSDEGDADWKYSFADEGSLIRGGDSFKVGDIRFDVLATPGHTPEHIVFVVTDEPASSERWGVITGDLLFVGDVGRPDLLEKAAGVTGTMEAGARDLFESLKKLCVLGDHVLVWPGHGAGSACGKSLGGVPVSTMGFERRSNWALQAQTGSGFSEVVLSGQPEPPPYFAEMKRLNKVGAPVIGAPTCPPELVDFGQALKVGTVLDTRPSEEFGSGHVRGTLNIPLDRSFTNWAGALVPYGKPVYVVAHSESEALEAVRDLMLIGLDDVGGWFPASALEGLELDRVEEMATGRAFDGFVAGGVTLLDVRTSAEHDEGHIPGSIHIPLVYLAERVQEVPLDRPIAVYCEGGSRSPIAASVLQRAGFTDVFDVVEGYVGLCRDVRALR